MSYPGRAPLLADPRARLTLGMTVTLVSALLARRKHVGRCETIAFHAVNRLPDSLYVPAWAVMQMGALGAAPATAAVAQLGREGELARRLLASGTATWALSKFVKRVVRRPRPGTLLNGAHCRGRQASGLGYVSGHAGVAVALGAAAFPHLNRAGRAAVLGAAPIVGLTRIYVGAHLPLDVVGGAALGFAVDAALALPVGRLRRRAGSGRTVARVPAEGPCRDEPRWLAR